MIVCFTNRGLMKQLLLYLIVVNSLFYLCSCQTEEEGQDDESSGVLGDSHGEFESGDGGPEDATLVEDVDQDIVSQDTQNENVENDVTGSRRSKINKAFDKETSNVNKRWKFINNLPYNHWFRPSPRAVLHRSSVNCLLPDSQCDPGYDYQCCGPSTFCVNYYGKGRCLAYLPIDKSDQSDPHKIKDNNNYKQWYNHWLRKAKHELG